MENDIKKISDVCAQGASNLKPFQKSTGTVFFVNNKAGAGKTCMLLGLFDFLTDGFKNSLKRIRINDTNVDATLSLILKNINADIDVARGSIEHVIGRVIGIEEYCHGLLNLVDMCKTEFTENIISMIKSTNYVIVIPLAVEKEFYNGNSSTIRELINMGIPSNRIIGVLNYTKSDYIEEEKAKICDLVKETKILSISPCRHCFTLNHTESKTLASGASMASIKELSHMAIAVLNGESFQTSEVEKVEDKQAIKSDSSSSNFSDILIDGDKEIKVSIVEGKIRISMV